ncbi:hypothetical protein EAF00_008598 [Botryotinia globosa]|nr:hypothetical protein EAF00_008598 [Botryotinia globosa]
MDEYYHNPHSPVTGAGDNTMDEYYHNPYSPVTGAGDNTMDEYYHNPYSPVTGSGDNAMDEYDYPVNGAGENTMDEYHQNPYYPITDPQQYPPFPFENAEASAGPEQDIDFHFLSGQLQLHNEQLHNEKEQLRSQYNQLQMQHSDLQDKHDELQSKHDELQSKHDELQSKNDELQSKYCRLRLHIRDDPIASKRLFLAARKIYRANLAQHDNEHEAPAENVAPAGGHRYITRSTKKPQPTVRREPVEDDDSNLASDREYAPSPESVSDEEMEDEDYEPATKSVAPATAANQVARPVAHPVAHPATAARHEVRFAVKRDREQNMLIYHRKGAYCLVPMTKEEFYHVKGGTRAAPRTFSMPDENGKIQDHANVRITEAENERLDAYRGRNKGKPHETREGTKDAAAGEL